MPRTRPGVCKLIHSIFLCLSAPLHLCVKFFPGFPPSLPAPIP
jgi:hypothetical protein